MARWKVAGALNRPKGRRLHWNVPEWQINVVRWRSSSATGICQYPAFQSNVEKKFASPSESRQSSMRWRGYASFTVRSFS